MNLKEKIIKLLNKMKEKRKKGEDIIVETNKDEIKIKKINTIEKSIFDYSGIKINVQGKIGLYTSEDIDYIIHIIEKYLEEKEIEDIISLNICSMFGDNDILIEFEANSVDDYIFKVLTDIFMMVSENDNFYFHVIKDDNDKEDYIVDSCSPMEIRKLDCKNNDDDFIEYMKYTSNVYGGVSKFNKFYTPAGVIKADFDEIKLMNGHTGNVDKALYDFYDKIWSEKTFKSLDEYKKEFEKIFFKGNISNKKESCFGLEFKPDIDNKYFNEYGIHLGMIPKDLKEIIEKGEISWITFPKEKLIHIDLLNYLDVYDVDIYFNRDK